MEQDRRHRGHCVGSVVSPEKLLEAFAAHRNLRADTIVSTTLPAAVGSSTQPARCLRVSSLRETRSSSSPKIRSRYSNEHGVIRALVDRLGHDLEPSILIGGWATFVRVGGEISLDIDLITRRRVATSSSTC
ncbi:MAG: hypothetical protein H7201_18175 [Candidatus Saccharibacteria bacterium]|nr:hypothetical protein [Microbacteriaceae bacterium]